MIQESMTLEAYLNEDYYISEESLVTAWQVIYFYPNFCCKDKINDMIHRYWASGIDKKIADDRIRKHGLLAAKIDMISLETIEGGVRALNLSDLSPEFYILLFGYLSAFFCLLFEKYLFHQCV